MAARVKFKEIIREPGVKERWERIRKFFFLRESTYDMTHRCNLTCEGCYYYEGDKQHAVDNASADDWRALMEAEKARGITFVVLAGAEPSLVPELLQTCYDVMPLGCIATNGIKKIPEPVGYKIHISVWGNEASSKRIRGAECLPTQLQNYAADPRAVFIYTFTGANLEEALDVVPRICEAGGKVSFNQFSATVGYDGPLRLDAEQRLRMRTIMAYLLRRYPDNVLYSGYNIEVHSSDKSLHQEFGCPYPRCSPEAKVGLGHTFRQYRSDLTWDKSAACCVPDTDCADCRHYAAGSAVVTSKLFRHSSDRHSFKNWLDYVDTYLAVWVTGYDKGENLLPVPEELREAR